MAKPRWRVVSKIYESQDYPIVEHIMYGQTAEEAQGYYDAHMKSDQFLRECVELGEFEGSFKCVERPPAELLPMYVKSESPPSVYAIAGIYEGIPGSWFNAVTGTLQRALFILPGLWLVGLRGGQLFNSALAGTLSIEVALFGYYGLRRRGWF